MGKQIFRGGTSMSLRISTNLPSLMAQSQLSKSTRELQKAYSELSTGSKHGMGNSDAAGFSIAEGLRADLAGLKAAENNAGMAASFVKTAEGGLNEENNILIRMRELAIQAASDTYSDQERGFIDMEFTQLKEELDRIAKTTSFGSRPLLKGDTQSYEFQVGIRAGEENRINYTNSTDTTADALGVSGLSISDKGEARDSLEDIDEGLTKIAQARAQFGAVQSRLESAEDFLSRHSINIAEAHSRVADANIPEAISRARKNEVLQQYQAQVLSMANAQAGLALKLVG